MLCIVIGVLACLSARAVAVVDGSNAFVYPGFGGPFDGALWQVGQSRPLEWYTNIRTYNITLWQMDPPKILGSIWETPSGGSSSNNVTFDWTVELLGADLTVSSKFMVWGGYEIYRNSSSGFTSYTFNISDSDAAASSTSSSSSSSTSTATSSSQLSSTPTSGSPADASQSATPSTAADNSGSNDDSLKIGLGVGLGVGLTLVLLNAAWFGRKWIKSGRRGDSSGSGLSDAQNHNSLHGLPTYGTHDGKLPPELSSEGSPGDYSKKGGASPNMPAELSTDRPVREML